jgi:hypothetical protein
MHRVRVAQVKGQIAMSMEAMESSGEYKWADLRCQRDPKDLSVYEEGRKEGRARTPSCAGACACLCSPLMAYVVVVSGDVRDNGGVRLVEVEV